MHTLRTALLASAIVAAALLLGRPARAQIDINPPLPNVLLLVDTSGSMEDMADGTPPATCLPGDTTSDMNRWATLVTVLTGTVHNRSCYKQNRGSDEFKAEFGLGGHDPYDAGYFLPFHRILSNGCTAGAGTLPADIYGWPNGAIGYHLCDTSNSCSKATACAQGFAQANDGLLDVYRDRVRFSLMTFDTRTDAGTGVNGGVPLYNDGLKGTWSYYLDWNSGGTPASGNPASCGKKSFEVGARNPAAPPWEGRLIPFGRADSTIVEVQQNNARIQEALLAIRPYDATPLDAMMDDAYTYMRLDMSKHPLDSTQSFAPAADPMFTEGCRQSYIILLSDGEPNLDLRPECEGGNGTCPYELKAYETAHKLATPTNSDFIIKTFAVGFGLSATAGINCNTLQMPQDYNTGGQCDGATGSLRACCTLARIAWEGGTDRAYFADDLVSLKSALSNVLSYISSGSTSRTMPAFASAASTQAANSPTAPAVSYQFTSSFTPGNKTLWSGNLERHRWKCESDINGGLQAVLEDVKQAAGDDFAYNLNYGQLSRPRQFLTVIADPPSQTERTLRPHLSGTADGLGTITGTVVQGERNEIVTAVGDEPLVMGLTDPPGEVCESLSAATSAAQCAKNVMRWELGGTTAGLPDRVHNELGAIYHATPVVLGAPRDYLRDESYSVYAQQQIGRAIILYTATTDGQLHAFKVTANDPNDTFKVDVGPQNNELWSFLPPFVLPRLISQFPDTQQILLDGQPAVKDVVFDRTQGMAEAGGATGGAEWHTVLVAAGRGGGDFYYALDVTDPENPQFLWQISRASNGDPLFGSETGTPAITTIPYRENGTEKEVAVAVLPGGTGTLVEGACQQNRKTGSFDHIDSTYTPRTQVRCWQNGPGRSLTIVRLQDGKVLMSFRGDLADGPALLSTDAYKLVDFDSPITGIPVPYPSGVGQVADRIYVGDADGTLWRVNLASADRNDWEVHLAFDAYSLTGDAPSDSQPVATPPVVAVDGFGNTIILYSTGDQEQFTTTGDLKARIWSLKEIPEKVGTKPFKIEANWFIPFEGGKRVTGPIALFDEVAYFATFTPSSIDVSACTDGAGSIWGVDYIESEPSSAGPRPLPRLAVDPNANPIQYVDEIQETPGTIVFGVAVTTQPSCFTTEEISDSYVGTHTAITASSPPTYQLVYQTGTGGQANQGSKTKTNERVLPPPRETSRIDSWASIVE